ncbi:MAG: cryptochrome/photolyase family protein [Acidimicrobiales bacterium]
MDHQDQNPGIVWFRRDLRLSDNPAWAAATARHERVVALFVLEPELLRAAGPIRRAQLFAHLHALDQNLRRDGGGLTIRSGPASGVIETVVSETGAPCVYVNAGVSRYARSRDATVIDRSPVPIQSFHGCYVNPPGSVLTKKGTVSKVFAPFFNTWRETPLEPWPVAGKGAPLALPGEEISAGEVEPFNEPGEDAAYERACRWLEVVDAYDESRDHAAVDGTSGLSTDLKFGTLSARTLMEMVGTATPGRAAFVRQLAWRDWWAHTLHSTPSLVSSALKPAYNNIEWRDDRDGFERWCSGLTGYPIVDAGMRQLAATGWMHNRVRMICASFLVKDLLIDWRWGERFLRYHLVDSDISQNAGNWQWVAGTGPDAAPYFRIMNPTTQAKRIDPRGDYIRKWVPELAELSAPAVHEPAAAGAGVLEAAGVALDDTYPGPMLDHGEARIRTLAAYKAAVG